MSTTDRHKSVPVVAIGIGAALGLPNVEGVLPMSINNHTQVIRRVTISRDDIGNLRGRLLSMKGSHLKELHEKTNCSFVITSSSETSAWESAVTVTISGATEPRVTRAERWLRELIASFKGMVDSTKSTSRHRSSRLHHHGQDWIIGTPDPKQNNPLGKRPEHPRHRHRMHSNQKERMDRNQYAENHFSAQSNESYEKERIDRTRQQPRVSSEPQRRKHSDMKSSYGPSSGSNWHYRRQHCLHDSSNRQEWKKAYEETPCTRMLNSYPNVKDISNGTRKSSEFQTQKDSNEEPVREHTYQDMQTHHALKNVTCKKIEQVRQPIPNLIGKKILTLIQCIHLFNRVHLLLMSMSYCKVKNTRTRGMKASVFNPQRILINLHYNISRRPRKLYPTGSVSNRSKARKGKTTRGMKASVFNPERILMNLHYSNSRHLRKLYPTERVSTRSKARKGKRTRKTEPWKREPKGRL